MEFDGMPAACGSDVEEYGRGSMQPGIEQQTLKLQW